MYVPPISALTLFTLHYELSTMHDPWLSHCKSSWSCMNCKMSSKNLCIEHADVPHAAAIWQSNHGRRSHLYETKGTWKNYPTCFALIDVGFMIVLRRADRYVLIWACSPVLMNPTTVIFKHCSFRTKPEKLLQCNLAFAMLFSKRCLWSCMVGLIQLPNSTRVICFQGHGPRGSQG